MFILEDKIRKNIKALKPYASARDEFSGMADVYLDANENPFPNGKNRYPDPHQRLLRNALSQLKGIDPSTIFTGNGSDEVIDLLMRTFCNPGIDNIITLPPTYGMYKVSAEINDVEVREVPLTTSFQPDVKAILGAADQNSKLLFICSPNNPTANLIDREIIVELLNRFEGLVVIDEAYIDFCPSESKISLMNEYTNLFIMQTLSKAWGLAGVRIGIGVGQPDLIQILDNTKPPYNISVLNAAAALEALSDPSSMKKKVDILLAEKNWLIKALMEMKSVMKVYASDANFLLVKIKDADLVYRKLIEQKIVVRNRSSVILCEQCLRITIGTPEENRELIQALHKLEA
ncbi:MAG: histidinol-phosphate transaminase [Bacteroidota bacterium]|nr:histidinol-phosphate transaminase [Bacteroidota bacterium]